MLDLATLDGMHRAVAATFAAGAKFGIRQPSAVQNQYARSVTEALVAARNAGDRPAVAVSSGRTMPGAVGLQTLLDAETGVGKTYGYLIPLLLEAVFLGGRARVVVSTYTVALQRQMTHAGGNLEKALLAVEAVTGNRLTWALRVGMRHFVDPQRAAKAILDLSPPRDTEDAALRSAFVEWIDAERKDESCTGQIAEFMEPNDDRLPGNLQPGDVCVTSDSVGDGRLFHERHAAKARAADVVITNHATVLYDTLSGGNLLGWERPIVAAVFDEADQIEQAAKSINCGTVSLDALEQQLRRASAVAHEQNSKAGLFKSGAGMDRLATSCADFKTAVDALNGRAGEIDASDPKEVIVMLDHPRLPAEKVDAMLSAGAQMLKEAVPLLAYAHRVRRDGPLTPEIEGAVTRIAEIRRFIEQGSEQVLEMRGLGNGSAQPAAKNATTRPVLALRWSPRKRLPSLQWLRLFPARMLQWRWRLPTETKVPTDGRDGGVPTLRAAVFTSATLGTRRVKDAAGEASFHSIREMLGLLDKRNPGRAFSRAFAPSAFGRAKFVFPDATAPRPFLIVQGDDDEGIDTVRALDPKWIDYVASMLQDIALHGEGRTLVLPTSFEIANKLTDALAALHVNEVIVRKPGKPAHTYDHDVLTFPRAIFVAPGCWEGYELRTDDGHNAFHNVVIPKVPFPPPDLGVQKGTERAMRARGVVDARVKADAMQRAAGRATAQRKLRQGFGRGIRDAADSMVFHIADPRFPSPKGLQPGRWSPVASSLFLAIPERFRDSIDGDDAVSHGKVFWYTPAARGKQPRKRAAT